MKSLNVRVLVTGKNSGEQTQSNYKAPHGYREANPLNVRETVIPLATGVTPAIEITAENGQVFYIVGEEAHA